MRSPQFPTLLLFVLAACDTTEVVEAPDPIAEAVWIANGGNFSDQNGTLSRLAMNSSTVETGPAVDGFVQAVEPTEGGLLVLLNTFSGGRVEHRSLDGRTLLARSADMPAPRGVVVVDDRAYVSAWEPDGTGSVQVLNLASASVEGSFAAGSYPEGIARVGTNILVANAGFLGKGTNLTAISLLDGAIRTVELGCDGPRDIVPLNTHETAVVCHGKTIFSLDWSEIVEQTNAQVVFVDGSSLTVQDRVQFDDQVGSTGGGQAAAASPEELLILAGAANTIRRVELAGRTEAGAWTLDDSGTSVGLSGIAYGKDQWYVGRMARAAGGAFPDFTAAGTVVVLDRTGVVTASLSVGSAPTHITIQHSQPTS